MKREPVGPTSGLGLNPEEYSVSITPDLTRHDSPQHYRLSAGLRSDPAEPQKNL